MKGISKILAAAVACLAIPAASQAASVVLSYTGVQTATNALFTTGLTNVAYVPGTPIVVTPGQFIRFNVQATVTGNPNTAGAIATSTAFGYAAPAQLGIAAFGASFTTSNAAIAAARSVGGVSSAAVNPNFSSVSNKGVVNTTTGSVGLGTDGAVANLIAGGVLGSGFDTTSASFSPKATIGTTTPQTDGNNLLFSTLGFSIPAAAPNGQATLTPSFPTSSMAFINVTSDGSINDGIPPAYGNRNFGTGDTLTGPGNIILQVGAVPEPTSLAVLGLAGAGLMARRRKA